ncbi:LysR family transcriptional regulator [Nitratireductor thuwali]|uniref:HTH-type transcriptional regulator GbpR n=1 Tax=Nitratireductor thuwali TaxID=2267699 RepID=A0ABY5MLJ2_9HYPH|nr:HTH-type transcriptional regulator GbpR [Nitratireductor thuwali]
MLIDATARLKLTHFRLIAAVAEHGQLSIAASMLGMTQPAASRMMTQIEAIVGAKLFERHAKGMELTDLGQLIARHADTLLSQVRDTMQEIDEFKLGKGGRVRVGAVTGAAVGYVMPAIQKLKAGSPHADVHIDVAPSDALIRELSAGNFDFVLGRIPRPYDPRHFTIARGRGEVVELLVRKDHPLAAVPSLSLHALSHYEWVMQTLGTPLRAAVETAFMEAAAPLPQNIINTTSLLAMIALLVTSDAIAPLSREVAELLGGNNGGLGLARLPVDTPIVVTPYHLLSLKSRALSPLAARLHALVTTELARGGAES